MSGPGDHVTGPKEERRRNKEQPAANIAFSRLCLFVSYFGKRNLRQYWDNLSRSSLYRFPCHFALRALQPPLEHLPKPPNSSQAAPRRQTTMDSMRSLNTSLPKSTPRPQPPEQLLQSFKSAALSVTTLYKNAVCEQAQAKQAGYQEAIEDLLQFLDKEDLGLGDGEGWKVRQWATERSDALGAPASDDEDPERRARSSSPMAARKEPREQTTAPQQTRSASPPKDDRPAPATHTQHNDTTKPAIFTFSAGPTYPQDQDVEMNSNHASAPPHDEHGVSVSVLSRNSRHHHRHGRTNPRSTALESPAGVGSKRKFALPDFFDLSGMNNSRDMFGGGKRGRLN